MTLLHREHGSTSDTPAVFDELFQKSRATFRRTWRRALEARYVRDLSWQSILNFPTGYAMSCREILRALDGEGVRVAYEYVYGTRHALSRARAGEQRRLPAERRLEAPERSAAGVSVVYGQGDVFRATRGRRASDTRCWKWTAFPRSG